MLSVKPISEQDPLESRRAWSKVADAIIKGDLNTTAGAKSQIETSQRELRKREKEEGKEWPRRYFSRTDRSPAFETLVRAIPGASVDADQTNGIWEFDAQKAAGT